MKWLWLAVFLPYSCVFSELMPSQSEHRSSRSVHSVQHFTLLRKTQLKLPPFTQAMAAVDSLAHGSCPRRHRPRYRGHIFRLNVHFRPKHRMEGFGHPHRGQAAFASRTAPIRSLSIVQVFNCRPQLVLTPTLSTRPHIPLAEVFSDHFLDKLFDLVEQTRNMQDETFNYSVIKLIVRVLFPSVIWCLRVAPDCAQRAIHGRRAYY
jgi:hypothetical protein